MAITSSPDGKINLLLSSRAYTQSVIKFQLEVKYVNKFLSSRENAVLNCLAAFDVEVY